MQSAGAVWGLGVLVLAAFDADSGWNYFLGDSLASYDTIRSFTPMKNTRMPPESRPSPQRQ